jgi:hypothetical protein
MNANYTIKVPEWLDRIFAWPTMWYRRWKYGYDFRRIYLGDDEWTIVDADIYYRLGQFKWSAAGYNGKMYATRILKQTVCGRVKTVYLHREIMNEPKGFFVDHKNNDSLDNRKANLRVATRSQNCQNVPKRKNTSSQFIGVSFSKEEKKWCAYINYRGKRIWLGYFDNEIDAAKAYDRAALKYYGEFARLNFPEEAPVSCSP